MYCNFWSSVLVIIFETFSDVHLFSIALSVFFFSFRALFFVYLYDICVYFSIEINIYLKKTDVYTVTY